MNLRNFILITFTMWCCWPNFIRLFVAGVKGKSTTVCCCYYHYRLGGRVEWNVESLSLANLLLSGHSCLCWTESEIWQFTPMSTRRQSFQYGVAVSMWDAEEKKTYRWGSYSRKSSPFLIIHAIALSVGKDKGKWRAPTMTEIQDICCKFGCEIRDLLAYCDPFGDFNS